MAMLSQVELNSIRETVACHQSVSAKLNDYAGKCTDPQIQQMFKKAATDAQNSAKTLLSML